jgi:PAS domain S-box-containing protein
MSEGVQRVLEGEVHPAPAAPERSGVKRELLPVLITLLLLSAVQVASFLVVVSLLREHENHRQLAHTLFMQRARVQTFVEHSHVALLGLATSDWEALIRERRAADEVARTYEETATALRSGRTSTGAAVPDLEDESMHLQLQAAERHWRLTKRAALDVLRADRFELKGNPNMAEFVAASSALTRVLTAALAHVDQRMLAHTVVLTRAQYALPMGTLLLLFMLGVFSYYRTIRPLDESVRALAQSEAEVREARDLLEHRVQERTHELVLATHAVRESQARLQSILDNTAAVVYMKDLDGRYLFVNRRYEQLFHVSNADMCGKRDIDLFPLEIVGMLRANDQRALEAGAPVQFEETIPQDDGPHHYVAVKFPLFDDAGQPYAIGGVSTDLTELKRAEEQLRHAQKMDAIGRLSGGIAHDFNNLLTAINGYSALVLAELDPSQRQHGFIVEILKAGERAAGLTKQLLAYSRKQVLEPKVWDLNVIVTDMAKMIRRLIGEDLGFVTAFGHEVGLINVDRGQVEQIILNLVVNARDAMPEGGKLTVETGKVVLDESYVATHLEASPGPHVYLAISDTGRGIAPAVAARMFEPFFTTKELGKGTGLGLSVVFGIVKQSGGSISVYSELGEGTTFRIYFPEATAPAEGLEDPPQVAPDLASLGGAEAILLVGTKRRCGTLQLACSRSLAMSCSRRETAQKPSRRFSAPRVPSISSSPMWSCLSWGGRHWPRGCAKNRGC